MRNWVYFLFLTLGIFLSGELLAQEQDEDSLKNIKDDIQVDVKSVSTIANGDTLSIELFLISYQMDPREFKLNAFATQVLDSEGHKHLLTHMKMGRVLVQLADRQNYLHYLLEEDMPVPLTMQVGDWKGKKASKVLLVFEDSTEEGRFITQEVDL
ncbi:hypothetical protein H8B06_11360 [Sphingobacterium sp. DN00404]|uniref:Uncharacterized protein n=1 Tax=Sphingobacterium micropteri TaxID=2763501 RepID=A0ABR7YQ22_9SPHI|nr:hypothetical protein [Sphingobacterium micropteri]MBD1433428.1 hypothetical protein [Sphingobacterium micropteri]